jgi:hypothetical protein
VVHVFTKPVRVGDGIAWAGRNEEARSVGVIVLIRRVRAPTTQSRKPDWWEEGLHRIPVR